MLGLRQRSQHLLSVAKQKGITRLMQAHITKIRLNPGDFETRSRHDFQPSEVLDERQVLNCRKNSTRKKHTRFTMPT